MRTLYLLIILVEVLIAINTPPNCNKCKYFIAPMVTDKCYIDNYFGKCNKFMTIDDNAVELKYRYAITARTFECFCGKSGRFFEQNFDKKINDTVI